MPTPIVVGRPVGPRGEVVTTSNQAWKKTTTTRLPLPAPSSHAKIQDATQMLAAKPTNPTAGIAR
jgi:hypothetical protein